MPNINGDNGNKDPFTGLGADIIVGRPGDDSDDRLLGNSTRPPFDGLDNNLGVIIIIGITGASQVQESATGQLFIEAQSLGTGEDLSYGQLNPFDSDSAAGIGINPILANPPLKTTLGESGFIF